ncbi:hypothetical protein EXIGLDRAFT_749954, partial [Exidia glandulosa HHB12029]
MSSFAGTPDVFDRNATDFANALGEAAEGHALWYPSLIAERGGVEGDCGYIDGGRFKRLFSVYQPPDALGLAGLSRPLGDDKIIDHFENDNDIAVSHKSITVKFGGNLQVPPLPQVPVLTVHCAAEHARTQNTLAFLAYCGPTRSVHKDCRLALFENYLLKHGDTIVDMYKGTYPVTNNNLVIIYQSTRCISWFSGLKTHSSSSTGVHLEADISGVGGGAHVGIERNEYRISADKHGPRNLEEDAIPSYSVVLRTVARKKQNPATRAWHALRAAAGFKTDGRRIQPPDSKSQSKSPPTSRGSETSSQEHSSSTSESISSMAVDSHSDNTSSADSSTSDLPNVGTELIAEQHDLLDRALEEALRRNPDIDVVVGNWDVVLGFESGLDRSVPGSFSIEVDIEHSGNIEVVGRLAKIHVETPPQEFLEDFHGVENIASSSDLTRPPSPGRTALLPTSHGVLDEAEDERSKASPQPRDTDRRIPLDVLCCGSVQPHVPMQTHYEAEFENFLAWLLHNSKNSASPVVVPETCMSVFRLTTTINFGRPCGSLEYAHISGPQRRSFIHVRGDYARENHFTTRVAFKNYKCSLHSLYFQLDLLKRTRTNFLSHANAAQNRWRSDDRTTMHAPAATPTKAKSCMSLFELKACSNSIYMCTSEPIACRSQFRKLYIARRRSSAAPNFQTVSVDR